MNKPDVEDKLALRKLSEAIVDHLPKNYGFLLIAAPVGDQPESNGAHVTRYVCNFNHENAIVTVREWLMQVEGVA